MYIVSLRNSLVVTESNEFCGFGARFFLSFRNMV